MRRSLFPILFLSFFLISTAKAQEAEINLSFDDRIPTCDGEYDKTLSIRLDKETVMFEGRVYHLGAHVFLLSSQLSDEQCSHSPYLYNRFEDVVAHLSDGTHDDPMHVLIAPGVYWVDNPDDPTVRTGRDGNPPIGQTVHCDYLRLTGLTSDATHVVLASQRGQTQGADGNFTMFDFYGDDLLVENLTMGNYCNVDLEYPLCPSLSRKRKSDAITQAQVAFAHGKNVQARNCRFVSRLNLCPLTGADGARYERCHFESTDDALNGSGLYVSCDFDFYSSKPFWTTGKGGAVFKQCTFRILHDGGEQYFCKHPGTVTLSDCSFFGPDNVTIDWCPDAPQWLRCFQQNVTLNGHPYVIGSGDFQGYAEVPHLLLDKNKAIIQTTLSKSLLLTASCWAYNHPALLIPLSWSVVGTDEQIVRLEPVGKDRCRVIPVSRSAEPQTVYVIAHAVNGSEAACEVVVLPSELPVPAFKKNPRIRIEGGVAIVDYVLDLQDYADESDIKWYRKSPEEETLLELVAVSQPGCPEKTYRLTPADAGKVLVVIIRPKHSRSGYGTDVKCSLKHPVPTTSVENPSVLTTDFRQLPCAFQPETKAGSWTVDGFKPADTASYPWQITVGESYWRYGTGNNGCKGYGLLQTRQGARLLYTPTGSSYGDMRLELLVDPCKTAGQGFSSATGQYMDIYLKFDTKTLTGYALRIIRTVKHSNAVDFMLMKYQDGIATPITDPITSTCYRTNCVIRLEIKENVFTATAETTTPQPETGLAKTVFLQAVVEPNIFGGFGIQHTGTTGEGTTMLHRLSVEW